jgi:hypothetical protein
VTQKAVCDWVKKYNWKSQADKAVKKAGGMNVFIDGFLIHLKAKEGAMICKKVKQHWSEYVAKIERDIG